MKAVALRPITRRQRDLVEAYVANGGNLTKAAEEAGYAAGNSGRTSAWKAMKTPHVQQYLMQVTAEAFGKHAAMAVHRVAGLANKAKSEYVQLQAAQDLLDRAGFKPVDRSQIQVAGDIKVSIDLG
jgi:phage terminase small subunit